MKKQLLIIGGVLLAALIAYKAPSYIESNKAYATMNTPTPGKIEQYTIKVGEPPQALLDRYPGYISGSVQPAGLAFYSSEPYLNRRTYATAHIEQGKYSFDVPNVVGFMGTYEAELASEGISEYSISFGITTDQYTPPEAARQGVLTFLKSLRQKGWKNVLYQGSPRLKGKDTYDQYIKNSDTIDPDYEITPDEWLKLNGVQTDMWALYADNVFMTLGFQREDDKKHPGMAAYLFSITLTTAENYYRGTVDPKDRLKWRRMWPDTERTLMQLRRTAERKAAQDCLELDLDYVDPPLPPDFAYTSPYKTSGIDRETYNQLRQHCHKAAAPHAKERWLTTGQVLPPVLVSQPRPGLAGSLLKQTENTLTPTRWTLIAYPDDKA